jgi:PAS domain S-box-containing protein
LLGQKRVLALSIVLALILAGVATLFVYNHAASLARARAMVSHTHQVIEENDRLFALTEEAETGERGYLLTDDASYLAPYTSAAARIPMAEANLAALVRDNAGQTEHVRQLNAAINDRLAFLRRCVSRGQTGDLEGARALVRDGRGPVAMSRIRDLAASIDADERVLLASRTLVGARAEAVNLVLGLSVVGLALIGLVGAVYLVTRGARQLEVALAEVTDARQAREASDALVGAVFENSPDYLFVLDIQDDDRFVIGEVNPAFETALRVKSANVVGKTIAELLPAPVAENLMNHYRRVRAADRPVLTRNVLANLPGGPRTWESILSPVHNSAGVTDRIIGSIRDITERVKSEERLRNSQRMEAIGQLTGGVAHDFNNLLQVIRGNLELLEPALAGQETALRRLNNALHGADRASQLTRQLLAFARRQPLDPQVVNISRMIGEMADLMRRTLGEAIEVETVIGAGLWNTLVDPAQVESAILNLAINARDAMPTGGRLTIEISNAALDDAYVRDLEDVSPGQYVLIAVSDTGQGMSNETRARVFEPFFSTKPEGKGTGLGLSMVYGFVRQSNGHVQIYSELGQGTTVKIYLPRAHQAEAVEQRPAMAAAPGAGQMILVVEDDPGVRAAAVATLEGLGYRCREAGDAQSAVDAVKAVPDVDLIFSDVVMPGPLKTRDFAAEVARLAPNLPILFTSGYTDNAVVHHGRLDPGVALLSKPYAREDLARKIAQMLAAHR